MQVKLPSPQVRQYVYGVIVAVVPVLAIWGALTPSHVGIYIALAGAVLGLVGNGQAAVAVTQQLKANDPPEAP